VSDIHIQRKHALGLERAREVAQQWTDQVEREYGMECRYSEGWEADVAQFARPGAEGTLHVTGDTFTLHMRLGFLMDVFAPQIEAKVTRNLDKLLGAA
jgi:putative polyhydroxyalkanoate system protein